MTDISDIQRAMVEYNEAMEAYWRDLDQYALKIHKGFAEHLGVDGSFWNHPETGKKRPTLDLGYRDPEARSYEETDFIPLTAAHKLPGEGRSLNFVLCLMVESPKNEKYKQLHFLDCVLRRDGDLISFELEGPAEDIKINVSRIEFENELPNLYEMLAGRIVDSFDTSPFN